MLMVLYQGNAGFVNTLTCEEQIPCIYDDASPFDSSPPIANVLKDGQWYYIDGSVIVNLTNMILADIFT